MDPAHFLEVAVQNLPGGLVLVDLKGKVRALNEAGQHILGIKAPQVGASCEDVFSEHPKIAKVLLHTCEKLDPLNRQEMTTTRPDGEKIVLGFGTLVLKNDNGTAVGVGMNFQDITRLIPLMDSHRFLDIALKNLPGGLVFIDLQGKIRGVNQMAERLLGIKPDSIEPGTDCHQALAAHPKLVKVLLATTQSLTPVNRQELTTHKEGEKVTLGYGTLILKDTKGSPVGIGMTFQDITRFIPLPLQAQFIRLVDRFFTPFASMLVLAGALMGFAETWSKHVSIALLLLLFIFNEVSVALARKHVNWAKKIGYTRIITNFVANVALVYMLGTFWGPMWLLFVLTPVATALYADWSRTVITALISAGALLAIYASRGLEGAVGWGQASIHAIFIVFISLFVNSVARMVMQIRSGTHPTQQKPTLEIPKVSEKSASSSVKLAA